MKKILLFSLFICMITFSAKPIHSLASFPDVVQDCWYAEHVEKLVELGYIKGYEDGRFGPNDPLIRENAARLIGRWLVKQHAPIPEDAQNVKRFGDIPLTRDSELVQVTALLSEEGIIQGASGMYDPASKLTRGQMALLLTRTIQYLYGIDLVDEMEKSNFQSTITDLPSNSIEMKNAIMALQYFQLTNNVQFYPNEPLTRAEFATFLNRSLILFEDREISLNIDGATGSFVSGLYTIPAGTKLYTSPTLKKVVGTVENEMIMPLDPSNKYERLTAIIGNKLIYIDPAEVAIVESSSSFDRPPSIGQIRLPIGTYLYADANLSEKSIQLESETTFQITDLTNHVVTIYANGTTFYANLNDRKIFAKLPHKLLNSVSLLNIKTNSTVGTLEAGLIIIPTTINQQAIVITAGSDSYQIPVASVLEVEDVQNYPSKPKDYNISVTFKEDALIQTIDHQQVGTIRKDQTIIVTNMDQTFGYGFYASIPVKFPLKSVYHSDIVNGNEMITYEKMVQQLNLINILYPSFTTLEVIGKTVEGRPIYALKLGTGKREIVMDASIHAREYLTTNVLMEMIDQYSAAYASGAILYDYPVRTILDKTSIWFIPMVNADGVSLVQKGVNSTPYKNTVIQLNGGTNVARWKANIRGVDLNRNFDGPWKDAATEKGPNWYNFKGYSVFSEPESQALKSFFAKHDFKAYISYHSSGNMLYYYNYQTGNNEKRDLAFARKISSVTRYYVMPPTGKVGSGSSADWFIRTYGKPGITMEISPYVGDRPVPLSSFSDIWNRNKSIGLLAAKESEQF